MTKICKKKTFPKEFFNDILVKVAEHEYIYIAEIRFEKLFLFKVGAKTKWTPLAHLSVKLFLRNKNCFSFAPLLSWLFRLVLNKWNYAFR